MVVSALSQDNSILKAIVLSVIVTAVLWIITSVLNLDTIWSFIVYIGLLFALYYLVLPMLHKNNIKI